MTLIKKITICLVLLATGEFSLVADSATKRMTRVGNAVLLEKFSIPQLGRTTTVLVQLPPNYESDTVTRYPVLYMLDGQNLVDESTAFKGEWHVDEYLQKRAVSKPQAGPIVVGIYNSSFRENEYIPFDYYKDSRKTVVKSEGVQYSEFIARTLKPYIDSNFRTLPDPEHTGIGGSSFGAYLSYYILWVYPEIFGRAMVFSMVNLPLVDPRVPEKLAEDLASRKFDRSHQKVFAEIGKAELQWTRMSDQQLIDGTTAGFTSMGLDPAAIDVFLDPNGEHNEETWSRSFPKGLEWIFGS